MQIEYCQHCHRNVPATKKINWGAFILFTVLTGGLWLFIYPIYHLTSKQPSCPICKQNIRTTRTSSQGIWFAGTICIALLIEGISSNKTISAIIFCIIIASYIGYKIYKTNKAKQLENEAIALQKQHELEANKIKEEILPFIHKFIDAYARNWDIWPENTPISPDDIAALSHLINSNRTNFINESFIKETLLTEVEYYKYNLFKKSFGELYFKRYSAPQSILGAELYQEYFNTNMKFVSYLRAFFEELQIYLSTEEWESLIDERYKQACLTRRSNELNDIMNNNKALNDIITINDTDGIDGIEFENILEKLFTKMGYLVKTTKRSGDQGADFLLEKNGHKTVVQAKRYINKLDNTPVQEVVAAKYHYQYNDAMVVTNNYFTAGAKELAATNQVKLIDRDVLQQLLIDYPINK